MEHEDLITDLKVLSKLKPNGRLCIRNGQMSIEPIIEFKENRLYTWSSYASLAIRRWWNQDNRNSALLKVQSVLMKVHDYLNRYELTDTFIELCTNAADGLANLQITYAGDAAFVSRLDVYIQTLQNIKINGAV